MKKIIYSVFVALFIVLNSCSDRQEFEDIYYNGVDPKFSETDIELGSLFAKSLHKTTVKLKEDKIDLKNQLVMQKVASEITLDVVGKKYGIPKEEMLMLQEKKVFFKQNSKKTNLQMLTTMQKRALNVIEHARVNSKSAIAFMDKLAAINRRVDDLVPKGERQLLHQIIAFEYYGLEEINKLVRAGYLPGKAEIRSKKRKIGTKLASNDTSLLDLAKLAHADGEVVIELDEIVIVVPGSSGNGISSSDWYLLQNSYGNTYQDGNGNESNEEPDSWWNTSGSTNLGTIWVIALAEPTPVGEIIAGVVTVGYVSYVIGDMIVNYVSSYGDVTLKECIEEYVKCTDRLDTGCDDALHKCRSLANQ